MVDVATLVYDIDSGPARTAATDLAKMNDAAARAAGGADKLNKVLRDNRGRFRSSADVARQYGNEVRQLAAKFNPALNAVYQLQQRQTELNRAVALGVITQRQADAGLSAYTNELRANAAASNAAAAASRNLGSAQRGTAFHTANVFAQLNDIGVMMAAGQNPIQLALQQGTQLNQVWASMGKEGRTLGGVARMLGGVFGSMINPMSLLTIGVIAGAAALSQWAMSAFGANKDAASLSDVLGDLNSSIGETESAIRDARVSYAELRMEYGSLADAARDALNMQVQLSQFQLTEDIRATQAQIGDFSRGISALVNEYDMWIAISDDARRSLDDQMFAGANAADAMRDLSNEYNMNIDDARRLLDAVNRLGQASGVAELQAAAAELSAEFINAQEEGAKLPPEMASLAAEIGQANLKLIDLINLAGQARVALGTIVFPTAPGMDSGDIRWWWGETPADILPPMRGWAPSDDGGGAAGADGGGRSPAEQLAEEMQRRWEALNEGFLSETALAMQHYARDLETLQWALEQRKITQEEHDSRMAEMRIANWGTQAQIDAQNYALEFQALQAALDAEYITHEQHYIRLRELQWAYLGDLQSNNQTGWSIDLANMAAAFGEMNQLAGGGYDRLLRAQKIFAAASALISTYQGAAKALELPFPMNIAAMGKVIAAGLGLVNAIKGGGKVGASSSSGATTERQEPTRYVQIHLDGPEWMTGMVEEIASQLYEQSENGRVIISRGGR